jgi:hypothetical protein
MQTRKILRHREKALNCLWYDLTACSDSSLLGILSIPNVHRVNFVLGDVTKLQAGRSRFRFPMTSLNCLQFA